MAAIGALTSLLYSEPAAVFAGGSGAYTTFAMAALNTGWCARFTAQDARDVLTVNINWSTVSSPGQVTCRLETIDATTGKPSGTLYDANATKAFTPTAGWQAITFDTPPTTGLTAGAEYAVVLLTTTGGTTQTLQSSAAQVDYPTIVLTAADGTTRSNFAEVAGACPVLTLTFEDASEEAPNTMFFNSGSTLRSIFGTNAYGIKFVTVSPIIISGYFISRISRVGTPAGNLVIKLWDSGGNVVSGGTVTIDKDSLAGVNARRVGVPLPAPLQIAAGTYRAIAESQSSANSSNCFGFRSVTCKNAAVSPASMCEATTTLITELPPTWSDNATNLPDFGIRVNNLVAATGGGNLVGGRLVA
jgi:hypothetical protein